MPPIFPARNMPIIFQLICFTVFCHNTLINDTHWQSCSVTRAANEQNIAASLPLGLKLEN